MKMKQVMDSQQALKQLEMVFAGKGGEVQQIHIPVLARVYEKLQANTEITIDEYILLAVYRDTVRRVHLIDLNKNHPQWKKGVGRGKGKKDKSFYSSPEYREKLRKAQTGKKRSEAHIKAIKEGQKRAKAKKN